MNNQIINNVRNSIHKENISLSYRKLPFKAATIEVDGIYGIFIDKKQTTNSDEEFSILAHEYGHCKSGATHKLYSPHDLIEKHEYMADRTAILEFLPINKLQEAFSNGCQFIWQIANYLDMPDKFVSKAIEHYRHMELLPIQ